MSTPEGGEGFLVERVFNGKLQVAIKHPATPPGDSPQVWITLDSDEKIGILGRLVLKGCYLHRSAGNGRWEHVK